jgi:hypothetical protein
MSLAKLLRLLGLSVALLCAAGGAANSNEIQAAAVIQDEAGAGAGASVSINDGTLIIG